MAKTNRGYTYPSDYDLEADVPKDIKQLAEDVDKDVSDLESDVKKSIPKNVSDLNNDSKFQTEEQLNESQEKQDQKILSLQQENKMLKNLLPTVSGKGTDVILKGTGEMPFKKLQVGGNSVQDGEPSLDNVVPIRNIEGSVNVSVCNKNLFDIEYFSNVNNYDGIDTYRYKLWKKLTKDTTFHITTKITGTYINGLIFAISNNPNPDNTQNKGTVISDANNRSFSITFKAGEKIYLGYWIPSADISKLKENYEIQIEESSTATEYVPHQQQSKTFPLEKGQVLHLGDYLANDGIQPVRITKKFDGTENWVKWTTSSKNYGYYCSTGVPALITTTSEIPNHQICSHFKCGVNAYNGEAGYGYVDGGGSACFTTEMPTVSEWKEYLAQENSKGTPVTIEYETKEKLEITTYTEEQQKVYDEIMQLTSYEGTTHVFSEDEISPIFDITAYAKGNDTVQQTYEEPSLEPPIYEEPSMEENEVEEVV